MPKTKLFPIVSLLSLGFLPLAQAADDNQDNRWYVAPFATFIHGGGDRKSSDGWGGGLGIGKIVDKHFNVELKGFYQGFAGQNGPWSMSGGSAEVQYHLSRDKLSPYTVISVGGMNSCLGSNCGAGFIGEAGLGFSYELCDNLLFRSDVRYRYNNNFDADLQPRTNEFNDMIVNAGFVIPFGDKPEPADSKAATPAPVAARTIAADCSAVDSDQDGVDNCLDKCPDTVKGGKVDSAGCPVKLVLKSEHFKLNSAELAPEAKKILDDVAANLIAYPQKNDIAVQGYTSSEGSSAYNLKLSQKRAQSVADYLKSKSVSNKLTVSGFGKSRPVADNGTAAGRAENRRVELIWLQD
ncbi:MAG: OmpA family protein [Methylococcales bacterium]|nr:OmpA family protein [Methylococcales bacterium]